MLPDGFEWQDYLGGHRLVLGTRMLAHITPLPDGGCRLTTNPEDANRRITFRPTYEGGRAYVEAWAVKWEARIRQGGDQARPLYGGGLMEMAGDRPATTHLRKRRR